MRWERRGGKGTGRGMDGAGERIALKQGIGEPVMPYTKLCAKLVSK